MELVYLSLGARKAEKYHLLALLTVVILMNVHMLGALSP